MRGQRVNCNANAIVSHERSQMSQYCETLNGRTRKFKFKIDNTAIMILGSVATLFRHNNLFAASFWLSMTAQEQAK